MPKRQCKNTIYCLKIKILLFHFEIKQAIKVVGDVNDYTVHERAIQAALNAFGKIDILFNNAGVSQFDTIDTIDPDQFDRLMNTNLRSIIFLTKACVPYLIKQKGTFLLFLKLVNVIYFTLLYKTRCNY